MRNQNYQMTLMADGNPQNIFARHTRNALCLPRTEKNNQNSRAMQNVASFEEARICECGFANELWSERQLTAIGQTCFRAKQTC